MVYIVGPLLALIAFGVFGRGMVQRSKGRGFNPLRAFLLLLAAFAYRFLVPGSWLAESYSFIGSHANLLERLTLMLSDMGIGLVLSSLYLRHHRLQSKLFAVPGVLALILSGGIFGVMSLVQNIHTPHSHTRSDHHEILVELGPDDSIDEIVPILREYKARYWKAFPQVDLSEDEDLAQFYLVCVDSAYTSLLLTALRYDRENVDYAEINHSVELIQPIPAKIEVSKQQKFIANDPHLSSQWYADKLNYNQVYEFLREHKPATKVKLAIVDTGVDSNHEDLKSVFRKSPGGSDNHSHGTHCAGIASAATNNGKGIGSLNWEGEYFSVGGYKALDRYGRGTDETVAKAIIEAAEGGAAVISMSLGGYHPRPPRVQEEAIKYAKSLGAIVVVAAGNSNDDAKSYSPANIPGVIVVSAVNESFRKAPFSNYFTQTKMPIASPGVNIFSTIPKQKYQSFNGTSMATPMVAGLVALMKSFAPELTTNQAYEILHQTGTVVDDSPRIGRIINPVAAIEAVQTIQ
ncbi:MAG: S8 family serine peptidase [Bacteroidota bacterium]